MLTYRMRNAASGFQLRRIKHSMGRWRKMGYHDTATGSLITRLFNGRNREPAADPAPPPALPPDAGWGEAMRAELVREIGAFLLRHRLDITPRNLALAHAIKTGSDLWLCEKLAERERSGQPLTQAWLDKEAVAAGDHAAMRDTLARMMESLEGAIQRFERSTQRATATTGEFRSEVAQQFAQLSADRPDRPSRRLVDISQAMLQTLQRIDTEMQRSQSETAALRSSLEQARADAYNDHLTRLPNRRAFEECFGRFHAEARASGEPLFVAICDIDHFKSVNDRFGHETGDSLLRAIAEMLRQVASSNCFVARHGGEEFVLLFRACECEQAVARIEGAQQALRRRRFVARRTGEAVGVITFSAGLADVLAEEDPRSALARADGALYRAKELGRDRVVCA